MPYDYHIADVFTDTPFGGNQLAVLPDARGLTTEQMAAITREFNFSESVFVLPPDDPMHTRKVRIFTPGAELPFAGHPTVGTGFVLAATGEIALTGDDTTIVLEEGVGPVPVRIRSRDGRPYFSQLTAAQPPELRASPMDPEVIASVVSLEPGDLALGEFAIQGASVGLPFLMVPLRSREVLERVQLRQDRWERALSDTWAPQVYLFVEDAESASRNGLADGNGVIRVRMFGPGQGVPEDPATGSAAAAFGGYAAARSSRRDGTLTYTIHQGVEMGRPSLLEVEVDVEGGEVRAIRVGGASVLVSSGRLHVP